MAERVARLASERAVVVFTKSGCCMSTAVTTLLGELAVSAAVHELDRDPLGKEMERELGGSLVGGTSKVMAMHLKGELVPLLKSAGALWL
uniref:Glutaredoxin domain-containing protein n=1 Tax=Oryza barthii TaxID=65489 RepID=A0A0D3HPK1_9ORYZ